MSTLVEVSDSSWHAERLTHECAGGAANVRKLTEEERKKAQEHNQKLRSASFNKDKSFLSGLKDKARDLVKSDKSEDQAIQE